MEIYTIGFTEKTAKEFFGILESAKIKKLLDIRLRNKSQLSGFAKSPDLAFFLEKIIGADYAYEPLLAPTDELLNGYRKQKKSSKPYESTYNTLIRERRAGSKIDKSVFGDRTVMLCSEALPDKCHRRLAAEFLAEVYGGASIIHL